MHQVDAYLSHHIFLAKIKREGVGGWGGLLNGSPVLFHRLTSLAAVLPTGVIWIPCRSVLSHSGYTNISNQESSICHTSCYVCTCQQASGVKMEAESPICGLGGLTGKSHAGVYLFRKEKSVSTSPVAREVDGRSLVACWLWMESLLFLRCIQRQ